MSEGKKTCQVCYESFEVTFVDCSCKICICLYCAGMWAKQQLEEQLQIQKPLFACPRAQDPNAAEVGFDCEKLDFDFLVRKITRMRNDIKQGTLDEANGSNGNKEDSGKALHPKQEQLDELSQLSTELNEVLLKHYVVWADDMRRCPQEGCNYSGTVDFNPQTELIECCDQLVCAKCDHSWRDPSQMRRFDLSLRTIISYFSLPSCENLANNLKKLMLTEPCPNCDILIEKNRGCMHMCCAKCNYEFCWVCLGHFKQYRHDDGMKKYCGQSLLTFTGVYVLSALILVLKIGQLPFLPSCDWLPVSPFTYLSEHFSSDYFFHVALRFCVANAGFIAVKINSNYFYSTPRAVMFALGSILGGYFATVFTHDILSVFVIEGLLISIAILGFWTTLALGFSGAILGCILLAIRTLLFLTSMFVQAPIYVQVGLAIAAGLAVKILYTRKSKSDMEKMISALSHLKR